jgi:peptidase E
MELHLFSTPGPGLGIAWVLEACREILGDKRDVTVAYLPQATLAGEKWLRETTRSFRDVGRIEMIDIETMELDEMLGILRRAALTYIPGGNAFLLNHRLHGSRLAPHLRRNIQNGLPVVAVSAGAVVCGPNILTSNDLNLVPTSHFDGLGLTPFNFNVHYADEAGRDNWLAEYHSFHDNPIIMLEDGAYVRIKGSTTVLVRGDAWRWCAGQEKEKLSHGETITPRRGEG